MPRTGPGRGSTSWIRSRRGASTSASATSRTTRASSRSRGPKPRRCSSRSPASRSPPSDTTGAPRGASPASTASSPAPAIPARTASSSTAAGATPWRSGRRSPGRGGAPHAAARRGPPPPPAGRGPRDSLRLEMGYALYGQEIDDTITPLEAGLGWIVKLDKGAPFTGLQALRAQKANGVTRKTVGFRLLGRGIARHGYPVWSDGKEVDLVRSGGQSPSLGYAIGTTMLPPAAAKLGTKFEIDCRGERIPAEVVARPFWKQGSVRKGA